MTWFFLMLACAAALAPMDVSRRGFGALATAAAGAVATSANAYASAGVDGDDVGAVDTAYFSGGDPRLLAPAFDVVRGTFAAETGAMRDGTRCVCVTYDPTVVPYDRLVGQFWRAVDPTRADGQFGDTGPAFRTAVWPTTARERAVALESLRRLDASRLFGDARVAAEVAYRPSGEQAFGFAEDAVQQWDRKNAAAYAAALEASGRSAWFEATYGTPRAWAADGADPWIQPGNGAWVPVRK